MDLLHFWHLFEGLRSEGKEIQNCRRRDTPRLDTLFDEQKNDWEQKIVLEMFELEMSRYESNHRTKTST